MLIFISVFIGIKRVLFVVFIASGGLLLAHPGNLDSRSGHRNHRTGSYHFHTPTGQAVPRNPIQERDWQRAFNNKVLQGQLEYYIQGKRVDILTEEYAVEVALKTQSLNPTRATVWLGAVCFGSFQSH